MKSVSIPAVMGNECSPSLTQKLVLRSYPEAAQSTSHELSKQISSAI
jgi:hypothetical protein